MNLAGELNFFNSPAPWFGRVRSGPLEKRPLYKTAADPASNTLFNLAEEFSAPWRAALQDYSTMVSPTLAIPSQLQVALILGCFSTAPCKGGLRDKVQRRNGHS